DRIERQLADIRSRTGSSGRPKTLLVFGREPGTLRNIDASGGVGFLHDMVEAAGGANVLADVKQQSVILSTELVLARAPEVINEAAQRVSILEVHVVERQVHAGAFGLP